MSERIKTPFTNEHFVAYCEKMLGQPYWYGTCGYKATNDLLTRKAKQYPDSYASSRTSRYKQDIAAKAVVCDCIGGAKGYAWSGGGDSMLAAIGTDKAVSNSYGSHGCPDKGANGMFTYAKSKGMDWGVIGTLPEVIGLALYKSGHVGYYVGEGYAIEWKGFAYGCVKTKVEGRGWTHWYRLPFIDYGDADTTVNAPTTEPEPTYTLGSRLLKKGCKGADVTALQEALLKLGYSLPKYGADSDYGTETTTAVTAFQKAEGLTADGSYGDKTHAALMDALADLDSGTDDTPAQDTPAADKPVEEAPVPATGKVQIVTTGGTVNIRNGNGTQYNRITTGKNGATYMFVATAANGWHAIVVNGQVGWVSGEYSRIS